MCLIGNCSVILFRFQTVVRLSVLSRHIHICSCDQYHTLSNLTVDFAFLCVATVSLARRRRRFALALREGPFCGHGCCRPRVSGMLSFVVEHVCQTLVFFFLSSRETLFPSMVNSFRTETSAPVFVDQDQVRVAS